MNRISKPLILLVFSFFSFHFAISQNTGTIKGIVKDISTDQKIQNTEVFIKNKKFGSITDKNGAFEIKNIPKGTYTLEAKVLGYTAESQKGVVVTQGQTIEVIFLLVAETIMLSEVTVSATKISKTIESIGSPVYIIGQEELEQTDSRNIEEALFTVPGVFTEDRFHNEANVVSFRGVGLHTHVTRGILVLVDGIPINEADGRAVFEGLDMGSVEKVEVLKGPVSALYGPNGITGVINIVEKQPQPGFHAGFRASYGTYNTKKLSLNLNGEVGGFKVRVKGNLFGTDGYQDRCASDSKKVGLKITKGFKNFGKLGFTADYITAYSEYAGPLDRILFAERSRMSSNQFTGGDKNLTRFNLNYTKQIGQSSDLFANLYSRSRYNEGHYRDSQFGKDDLMLFGGEVRFNTRFKLFNKPNAIVFGSSMDKETGDESLYLRDVTSGEVGRLIDQGKSIYEMLGLYVQDEFTPFEKLVLTFGVRYDHIHYDWSDLFHEGSDNTSDENSKAAFSPKLGFAYNPLNSLTIFGNVARGFNPPQITQLFIGSSYSGLPNPDLKPEYMSNYELGMRGVLAKKVNFQTSVFVMNFKDQIVAEGQPPVYQNIGDTKHLGLEASVNADILPDLMGYATYSYLDASFVSYLDLKGNTLRKTPKHQATTGLRYQFDFGLTASAEYKYMSSYFMDNDNLNVYDGHSLVNGKLIYKRKKLFTSLSVNNIFDVNYATWAYASGSYNPATHSVVWEQDYYPGWPRNFTLSVGMDF